MSTGIARIEQRHDFQSMRQIADVVSKSGLFGRMTEPQVLTLMMLCESEGLHPIKALQLYDIIDGKPSLKAAALLARFMESGGSVEWHEQSNTAAEATFTHAKTCPSGVRVRYTLDDAKLACLLHKDNWKKNPADMLVARVCSRGAKRANPASILGMELPEGDEPPAETETKARASLVERLAGRRESPKELHPPVAETAQALKEAPRPEPPPMPAPAIREPESEWGKMITGATLEFNSALAELAEANPDRVALRTSLKPQQVIRGVLKAYIDRDAFSRDVLQTNGKEDRQKVSETMSFLWGDDQGELEATVAKYLGDKLTELMGPAPAPAELAMA